MLHDEKLVENGRAKSPNLSPLVPNLTQNLSYREPELPTCTRIVREAITLLSVSRVGSLKPLLESYWSLKYDGI